MDGAAPLFDSRYSGAHHQLQGLLSLNSVGCGRKYQQPAEESLFLDERSTHSPFTIPTSLSETPMHVPPVVSSFPGYSTGDLSGPPLLNNRLDLLASLEHLVTELLFWQQQAGLAHDYSRNYWVPPLSQRPVEAAATQHQLQEDCQRQQLQQPLLDSMLQYITEMGGSTSPPPTEFSRKTSGWDRCVSPGSLRLQSLSKQQPPQSRHHSRAAHHPQRYSPAVAAGAQSAPLALASASASSSSSSSLAASAATDFRPSVPPAASPAFREAQQCQRQHRQRPTGSSMSCASSSTSSLTDTTRSNGGSCSRGHEHLSERQLYIHGLPRKLLPRLCSGLQKLEPVRCLAAIATFASAAAASAAKVELAKSLFHVVVLNEIPLTPLRAEVFEAERTVQLTGLPKYHPELWLAFVRQASGVQKIAVTGGSLVFGLFSCAAESEIAVALLDGQLCGGKRVRARRKQPDPTMNAAATTAAIINTTTTTTIAPVVDEDCVGETVVSAHSGDDGGPSPLVAEQQMLPPICCVNGAA